LGDDIGLMDYKARFYSPVLNRFIQPDSIIPDPTNPQAWNRFSYVNNRPINLNDPTGHFTCSNNPNSDDYCPPQNSGGSNRPSTDPAPKPLPKPKDQNANPCQRNPPYKPEYTCGGVVTEPGGVTPMQIIDPVTGDGDSDGVINFNYVPPSPIDYISALLGALQWLHYNTPMYGAYAYGYMPSLHHNETGINTIHGVIVYNHTGMDLTVTNVSIGGNTILTGHATVANPSYISDNNSGAIEFHNPIVLPPNIDLNIQITFITSNPLNNNNFGYGIIEYSGPAYLPPYSPIAPYQP
jgi:RHS repeat-associated protein